MIPKVIHYCWYGRNKKSKLIKKCINSWKQFFPEYEIIEWNEDNTDLNENEYIRGAYNTKRWAFVSDYVRMKVLYKYGGIYFDTDVQVIKHFPKELLLLDAFTGIEEYSKYISPGLVFGCNPGNRIVEELVNSYDKSIFNQNNIITVNKRITDMLMKRGYRVEDIKQEIDGLTIFPSSVFCGYDGEKRRIKIQDNTLSVHHYAHSWFTWKQKLHLMCGTIIRRLKYLGK